MILQINVQLDILIYSFLAGIITGILFDAYRIVRGFKVPKYILVVEDILFWSLCALVVFTFLLYTNYAFLSLYVYVFIGIAVIFYIKLISPYIFKTEKTIGNTVSKSLRLVGKNFIYPFKIFMAKMGNKNK